MSLYDRLHGSGPKRILTLDAGGMRGFLSLGILVELERRLRALHADPSLRLCDYFDLISGTSAGSLIAAALSRGSTVTEVLDLFHRVGDRIFARRAWSPWRSVYRVEPLQQEIERLFGDLRLDDGGFESGLLVFAKRADTNETWAFCNDPAFSPHGQLLLRDVLRASCSVPGLFPPKVISLGHGERGVFVDGGVGPAHDPALSTFLQVTEEAEGAGWATGEDELLVVSVGTGFWSREDRPQRVARRGCAGWLWQMPRLILQDAGRYHRSLLRAMSRCPAAHGVQGARHSLFSGEAKLTYLRYDASLDSGDLLEMGLDGDLDPLQLRCMTCAPARFELARIGRIAGRSMVRSEHFPPAFQRDQAEVLS